MTADRIAAARALIEPLTGYTPGPWEPFFGEAYRVRSDGMNIATAHFVTLLDRIPTNVVASNTCLIAAAPDLRDMVATLADALEAERAKVAVAYEAAAELVALDHVCDAIRALADPDAKAALDKMLAEARLEGWRAGREAATEPLTALAAVLRKSENSYHQAQASAMLERADAIRALTPSDAQAALDKMLAAARAEAAEAALTAAAGGA